MNASVGTYVYDVCTCLYEYIYVHIHMYVCVCCYLFNDVEECSTCVHSVGTVTTVRSDDGQHLTTGDQPAAGGRNGEEAPRVEEGVRSGEGRSVWSVREGEECEERERPTASHTQGFTFLARAA